MNKFNEKVLKFATALQDMYKDEEEREASNFQKMEFKEEELTEDFTAMIFAVFIIYKTIADSEESMDFLDFTHIANRLAVQHMMEEKWEELD